MLFKQAFVLIVVSLCGVCSAECPNEACNIKCQFGFSYNKNKCQLCKCLPNPCSVTLCATGTTCELVQNECKDVNCPLYKAVCKKEPACDPVLCKIYCKFGFLKDVNGCEICKCNLDPCLTSKCGSDQICVADDNSEEGYKCASPDNLCCPSPKPPSNCSSQHNVCQSCFRDCTTMKCGGKIRCCPDYFGCYGCRNTVLCPQLV